MNYQENRLTFLLSMPSGQSEYEEAVRHKFQNMLDKYDDLYSLDLFGETTDGYRNINPYEWNPIEGKIILNRHVDEDRESLSSVPTIEGFEDLKGIE